MCYNGDYWQGSKIWKSKFQNKLCSVSFRLVLNIYYHYIPKPSDLELKNYDGLPYEHFKFLGFMICYCLVNLQVFS